MPIIDDLRFYRGLEQNLPPLAQGQPAVTLDTNKLFVGTPNGNIEFAQQSAVSVLQKTPQEYEWTTTAGQIVYVLPSGTTYDTNSKWLTFTVGGATIEDSLIKKDSPTQFTLLVDPSLIPGGVKAVARWVMPYIPAGDNLPSQVAANTASLVDITTNQIPSKAKQVDLDATNSQVSANTNAISNIGTINANAELVNARGTYSQLVNRLNASDASMATKANQSDVGDKTTLITSDKSSLTNAINENAKKIPYVTPENFGSVGDGVTDDSTAFINMYSFAQTYKVNVKLTKPHYIVKRALSATGVSTFSEVGSILDIQVSSATYGNAFVWGGENTGVSGVVFWLSNSNTDVSMQGIYNSTNDVKNQWFINNRVVGKTFKSDGVTGNIYGGWINAHGITNLRICNNVFETVNYPCQINQQQTGGNIATPMGNPITNVYIENNTFNKGTIGINTPHVYCDHIFIKNNRITSDTGFNINIAHCNNFVVDGNICDGATNTTDSVIHIEDVSYSGTVVNNIIRSQNSADGIRITVQSGVSQDTYVPTEGILIANNDLKGVGNANAINITDTSSKRIKVDNNRIESYSTAILSVAAKTSISNNQIKSCTTVLNLNQRAKISGLFLESCTNVISSRFPNEINGLTCIGEVPNLQPVAVSGYVTTVIYRNVQMSIESFVETAGTPFNLFTLPTIKFNFNLYYKILQGTSSDIVRLTANYDGTTFTPTKTFEVPAGSLGSATFAMTSGYLTVSHSVGTLSTASWDVSIDSIVYAV